jgi:biopolymer transport protein ExbD
MAELGGGGGGKKKGGKVRVKKSSTRIDMTPMVDLAFLLLTFFVMTTTLNKPQAMQITMPDKPKEEDTQTEVNEKNVLTLIMGDNDKIYYYMGITDPEVKVTNFSATGIRKILMEKKAELPKLVILIKSLDESRYKNMVDIMDEMNISGGLRAALVDITQTDKDLVKDSQL